MALSYTQPSSSIPSVGGHPRARSGFRSRRATAVPPPPPPSPLAAAQASPALPPASSPTVGMQLRPQEAGDTAYMGAMFPPAPAGSPPPTTGYGPGNDLRNQQVTPQDTADQTAFRTLRMNAANTLASGPSRGDIAQKTLDAFDLRAQPKIRDQIRSVGQQASRFGRLGMGDTAVETTRPFTDYLTERAALSSDLAARTAEGEIGDRFDSLDSFRGLVGDEEGIQSGRRNELRGERGFQRQMGRDAIEDSFRTHDVESGDYNDEFDRYLRMLTLGYGMNPTSTFLDASRNRRSYY